MLDLYLKQRLVNVTVNSRTLAPKTGELHSESDPGHHEQEVQHQKHICDRPRGSWQVHSDRLTGVQSGDHSFSQGRRDALHRHSQRRAGALHHHQIDVSVEC